MTTKQILLAIALLNAVFATYILWPYQSLAVGPIPAAKLVQNFDPETATPEEIRAYALRVAEEALTLIPYIPEDAVFDIIGEFNPRYTPKYRAAILIGQLGDMPRSQKMIIEIVSEQESADLPKMASALSAQARPEDIKPMLDRDLSSTNRQAILFYLIFAYANNGEYERAEAMVTEHQLPPYLEDHPINEFEVLGKIIRSRFDRNEIDLVEMQRLASEQEVIMIEAGKQNHLAGRVLWSYIRAHDPESAIRMLRLADLDNGDVEYLEIGKAQLRNGDILGAQETWSLVEWDEVPLSWLLETAEQLAERGGAEAANAQFEEAIRIATGTAETRGSIQGLLAVARKQLHLELRVDAIRTVAIAREFTEASPADFGKAHELIAHARFEHMLGNTTDAGALLDRALKEGSIRQHRSQFGLLLALSDAHAEFGNPETARKMIDMALAEARFKRDPALRAGQLVTVAKYRGMLNQTDEAYATLDEALRVADEMDDDNQRAELLASIGSAEWELKDLDRALRTLRRLVPLDESRARDLSYKIGTDLAVSGQVSAAMDLAGQIRDPLFEVDLLLEIANRLLQSSKKRDQALQTP